MTAESSAKSKSPVIKNQLRVAVLMGGVGAERDISIQSGNCVAQALEKAGLNVVIADIQPDNMDILDDSNVDVFFIALHGRFGEDGQLQQILEDKSLIYTGSGPEASRLAFDKMAGKKAFAEADIDTPPAIEFNAGTDIKQLEKQIRQFAEKYVIKPIRQGSSVGISIVTTTSQAIVAAQKTLNEFGDCMIEKFVPGRELTVGVLCGKVLPVIEIRPKQSFYNYHAKYIDEQTEFLFDTINDPALTAKIEAAALNCFNALGCRDFARVDFILGNDHIPYALEVNTIPGFTTHSLLPRAAAKAGFSMSDLCVRVIDAALKNKKQKNFSLTKN